MSILLVEDDFLIRLMIAEELSEAGYAVYQAEDGTEAARLIENPPAPLTLLITDIHMPGRLDGIQVATLMRARFPDAPIIYTTGRPDILDHMDRLGLKQTLLPKPFTPSDLITMIRQVLRAT